MCLVSSLQPMTTTDMSAGTSLPRCWSSGISSSIIPSPLTIRVWYSVVGVVLALLCAVPAGYGLALTEFAGRRVLLSITLLVMIMPASALVLPLFLELNVVHVENTGWSVALAFGFFPFGVYLSYIFFSPTIPKELLPAARVDGASEWGVFVRIELPLARPIVARVGFFAFVSDWTNFFLPYGRS